MMVIAKGTLQDCKSVNVQDIFHRSREASTVLSNLGSLY